jgi:hypothetical protein
MLQEEAQTSHRSRNSRRQCGLRIEDLGAVERGYDTIEIGMVERLMLADAAQAPIAGTKPESACHEGQQDDQEIEKVEQQAVIPAGRIANNPADIANAPEHSPEGPGGAGCLVIALQQFKWGNCIPIRKVTATHLFWKLGLIAAHVGIGLFVFRR